MKQKNLQKIISFICVIALIITSAGVQIVYAAPSYEEKMDVSSVSVKEVPINIQTLLKEEESEQKGYAEKVLPSETAFEIRTERSNGSYLLEVYGTPVCYQDSNDNFKFINTAMEEISLKDRLTKDYSFKNTANEFTVLYSKDAGKGLNMNDDFKMAVADKGTYEGKSAVIDTDEYGDGRITYPEAFGTDTYLEYINVSTGIKENIVLNKNIGQNRFNFIWTSDTLIPILTDDSKSISFVKHDDYQRVDYIVSPLYVYDSYQNTNDENEEKAEDNANSESISVSRENTSQSEVVATSEVIEHTTVTEVSSDCTDSISEKIDLTTETESAVLNTTRTAEKEETTDLDTKRTEEKEETTTVAVQVKTEKIESASLLDPEVVADKTTVKHFTEDCHYEVTCQTDGVYIITAVISEDFLNDPNTVYPVVIDPSVTSTSTASNIDDTYVSESYKSTNYGSYTYMCFGYNSGKRFGYVRFNTLPSIPSGSQITSANIKLTFRPGQTTSYQGVMFRVAAFNWTETGLTWNNQPYGYDCGAVSSHNNCSYYQFEATNLVKGWYNGTYPNYGIDFTYSNETYNDYNSVYSIEGSTASAPKLTIYYDAKKTYINQNQQGYNSSYDRSAAAQYAYDYGDYNSTSTYDTPNYYSTNHSWSAGDGYDCTNFVSQCLYAGGMIHLTGSGRTQDDAWYYDTLLLRYYSTYTWGGAPNFARHWGVNPDTGTGIKRAYMVVIYQNAQQALSDWNYIKSTFSKGDIIQTKTSVVNHTMILHDTVNMLYAQHTSNQVNVSLYNKLVENANSGSETGFIFYKIK